MRHAGRGKRPAREVSTITCQLGASILCSSLFAAAQTSAQKLLTANLRSHVSRLSAFNGAEIRSLTSDGQIETSIPPCLAWPVRGPVEAQARPGRGPDGARCKNTTISQTLKNKRTILNYSFFQFYKNIVFLHRAPSGPRAGPRLGHGWAPRGPRKCKSNRKKASWNK